MRNFFKHIGKNFSYDQVVGLTHINGELVASASNILEKNKVIETITYFIYTTYYSKLKTRKEYGFIDEVDINTDNNFMIELSKIHPYKTLKSYNWLVIKRIERSIFKVLKNNITLTIDKNVHLPKDHRKLNLEVGSQAVVLFSCHYPNISHGFYVYKSEIEEVNINAGIGRLYFNINHNYAIDFTKKLLTILYETQLKFDYKIFKNIRNQYRIDSAVLYFSLDNYREILNIIKPFLYVNEQMLNNEVSIFHQFISKGVGFAEEPLKQILGGESYGWNRCRIIAEVIYDSLEYIKRTGIVPLEKFIQKFIQKDIDINRIYLSPSYSHKQNRNITT